jgi:hypothetical protein
VPGDIGVGQAVHGVVGHGAGAAGVAQRVGDGGRVGVGVVGKAVVVPADALQGIVDPRGELA